MVFGRKIVVLMMLITIIATGSLFAEGKQEAAGAGGEKKTSVLFWTLEQNNEEVLASQIDVFNEFEEEYPNITLEVERFPFANWDDKTMTALEARTGPDVLLVNSVSLAMFIERGYVQPTSDLIAKSSDLNVDDFFPGLWKHVDYLGESYGLPIDTGTRLLIYNKELIDEAGINFGDETPWQAFKTAAQKTTADSDGDGITDQFGYAFGTGEKWVALYENVGLLSVQNDGYFLNEGLTKSTVNSPEIKEAFEFFVGLHEAGVAPKESVTLTDQTIYWNMFNEGKVATFMGGHWAMDWLESQEPVAPYGLTLTKKKQIGSSTGGWILAMSSHTEKRESVWNFMEYMFKPNNLIKFTSIMPATKAANDLVMKEDRYRLYKKVLPYSRHPIQINKDLPEMAKILKDELQNMLLDRKSVSEALDDVNKQYNNMLSD